jgi:hypothetical protein
MKIMVVGGTGLVDPQIVTLLQGPDHEIIVASPSTGINTITGQRPEAIQHVNVVIDLSNVPPHSTRRLIPTSSTLPLPTSSKLNGMWVSASYYNIECRSWYGSINLYGIYGNKGRTRRTHLGGGHPIFNCQSYFIFGVLKGIAEASVQPDGNLHLSPHLMLPIAAADLAKFIAQVAIAQPRLESLDLAGPDWMPRVKN